MNCYSHALVLVHNKEDGTVLLSQAARLAEQLQIKITLAHVSDDYREMNYVSDSLMDDVVSEEVINARALMSELVTGCTVPVDTREIVTIRRLDDVEKCVTELGVDLVIVGHRNRFLGSLTSRSMEYINHLNVDVLTRHIPE